MCTEVAPAGWMDDDMDEELKKDEEELTANKELVINSIPTHSKKKHSEHGLTSSVQTQTELLIQTEIQIQIQIQMGKNSVSNGRVCTTFSSM